MNYFKEIRHNKVNIFLTFCIIIGIILHVVPFIYKRSLWIDEAMLISSICTRSFSELVATPLDWGQSAPIGWLFIVKLITTLWNTSETALRIFSLTSAFCCTYLIYALLKNKVSLKFALWATAIFSLTQGYIYYANEAKPYMADNMFCLLALFAWQKYREKSIAFYQLCLLFATLIWFSFSAVFFIAACMIIEIFIQIRTNQKEQSFLVTCGWSFLILVSFLANYLFWLAPTSSNAGGLGYWALLRFPLIPTNFSDVYLMMQMYYEVWQFYQVWHFCPMTIALFFTIMTSLYIFLCIKRANDRSKITIPYVIATILILIASALGFYPIAGRLLQVLPIVSLIIVALASDDICKNLKNESTTIHISILIQSILFLILVYVGMYGCTCLFKKYVYIPGSQISASIEYLKQNLNQEDVIYVYNHSIPIYTYEKNFNVTFADLNSLSQNKTDDNILPGLPHQFSKTIYGQELVKFKYKIPYSYDYDIKEDAIQQDAELISKNNSVYLFTSHDVVGIPNLINVLNKTGNIEIVVDSYNTKLYHYTKRKL